MCVVCIAAIRDVCTYCLSFYFIIFPELCVFLSPCVSVRGVSPSTGAGMLHTAKKDPFPFFLSSFASSLSSEKKKLVLEYDFFIFFFLILLLEAFMDVWLVRWLTGLDGGVYELAGLFFFSFILHTAALPAMAVE
jgi:hypothetical protein